MLILSSAMGQHHYFFKCVCMQSWYRVSSSGLYMVWFPGRYGPFGRFRSILSSLKFTVTNFFGEKNVTDHSQYCNKRLVPLF